MPPPLRSSELCNGTSLGPEMATIQVISVLILVLGFGVFHTLSSPGDLGRSSRKIFKRLILLTADANSPHIKHGKPCPREHVVATGTSPSFDGQVNEQD